MRVWAVRCRKTTFARRRFRKEPIGWRTATARLREYGWSTRTASSSCCRAHLANWSHCSTPHASLDSSVRQAAPGAIEIHLRASGSTDAEAEALLAEVGDKIELALGDSVFSTKGESLEE